MSEIEQPRSRIEVRAPAGRLLGTHLDGVAVFLGIASLSPPYGSCGSARHSRSVLGVACETLSATGHRPHRPDTSAGTLRGGVRWARTG